MLKFSNFESNILSNPTPSKHTMLNGDCSFQCRMVSSLHDEPRYAHSHVAQLLALFASCSLLSRESGDVSAESVEN
jgi:hypothetical protein